MANTCTLSANTRMLKYINSNQIPLVLYVALKLDSIRMLYSHCLSLLTLFIYLGSPFFLHLRHFKVELFLLSEMSLELWTSLWLF